mmetsp:Transcript_11558/g.29537  ORF Transcript_11558/g.29537 Transcript_11558/m.29537 type:complete len:291 (+) Transcript_11558:267-1139(+)
MATPAGDDAAAFQRLYPDQHYDRFLESGVRPDGRVAGMSREVTIGLGAVSSAASSALVKVGPTIVMAGIKLGVMKPSDEDPEAGALELSVEMTPMSSPEARPGRPPEAAHAIAHQLHSLLLSSGALDLKELCIRKAAAAWAVSCDIYVLNADGGLLDAALIAAVSALAGLQLPEVAVTKDGAVVPPLTVRAGEGEVLPAQQLQLRSTPLALTCGLRKGQLIADPSSEEEQLMECTITVALDAQGNLAGVYKPGGDPVADTTMAECIQAAMLRYNTVSDLLSQALAQQAQE